MKLKYTTYKEDEFEYQLNEFGLFGDYAFNVWNRYADIKALFNKELNVNSSDFVRKVKKNVNKYIEIQKTNEILSFFHFIEKNGEKI